MTLPPELLPPAVALRKRQRRAEHRERCALAGGWGAAAQESAWAARLPRWRELLGHVTGSRLEGNGGELVAAFEPLPRHVKRAWLSVLRREQTRLLDAALRARGFPRRSPCRFKAP
jgi:hypothetical protein